MSKERKEKSVISQTLKIFWEACKKHKFYTFASFTLFSSGVLLQSYISPLIISNIINKLQNGVPADKLWEVFSPSILTLAVIYVVSELVIWRVGIWILWKLETVIYQELYEKTFSVLIRQSMGFHSEKMSGTLVSQARNFANSFTIFFDTLNFNVLPIFIGMISIAVVLTPISPIYTLGLFVLAVTFTVIALLGTDGISKTQVESTRQYNKLGGRLSDALSNILAVKSNSREKFEIKKIHEQGEKAIAAELKFAKKVTIRDIGFASILAAGNILIVICAVFGRSWFEISIGTLILMMTYSQKLIDKLWDINRIIRNFSKAFSDADAVTRILQEEIRIKDVKNAKKFTATGGKIEIKNIDFRHDNQKHKLFENFNLSIKPGEKIGLVGSSGSGKTTLTKLLLRFSDIEGGKIEIDGQDISKVTQKTLRGNIAYVPQESILFHRTIGENIAYGRPDATEKEIIKAAKLANAWEFIKNLPEGLNTKAGDRGLQLSGGQRQRISIARAILKNSPILILDEATSALDTESEKLIQDALENLMKNRTSIVIAHRLSTVQKLDRIIVIDEGEIIEDGSHEDLLKLDGTYAKLWNIQSGK